MTLYLLTLIKILFIQIISLFGIFFVFGIVLSKLQKWTQLNYGNSIGWKGILWTAWFGTPFHEYSHVFFAKLFKHKIQEIALFRPNQETGELGYVHHSWNTRSFYQSVGNFFIGMAPMIFGSTFLVFLLYLMVPNSQEIFSSLPTSGSVVEILKNIGKAITSLFNTGNLKNGWFWLFLYLSFCIASHIAPSKADRKGVWHGLALIIITLTFINILTLLVKWDITKYIIDFSHWLSIFMAIFTYAAIISFVHFLLSSIILLPFKK